AHLVWDERVRGSNPLSPTTFPLSHSEFSLKVK
ncbi:MAG: hypothetical protein ACI88H_001508, partial [Cocleimonas sp.]